MSYLDEYDSRRPFFERLVRWIGLALLVGVLGYSVYWLFFRNWREEAEVRHFLEEVQQQKFEAAYKRWGCSVEEPCRYYSYTSFLEDWGPDSPLGKVGSFRLGRSYTQEGGVIIEVWINDKKQPNLWVDSATEVISFFPY
ncbi:MAG: hypothetical protein GC160_17940 [Acidobacteria bacterium]|nr:hypothetical protein [Acidobacteriota bacterium]